jgi:hypothetical protein
VQARRGDAVLMRPDLDTSSPVRQRLAVQLRLALVDLNQPDAPHRRTTGGQQPARQTSTTTGAGGRGRDGDEVRTLDGLCRFFDIGGALQRAGEW